MRSPVISAAEARLRRSEYDHERGRARGQSEGRREMLWLMAVGANLDAEFAGNKMGMDSRSFTHWSSIWHHKGWCMGAALRALADLGDTRAQEILRGER